MKNLYIFLITLVAVNQTIAQWVPQTSGTTDGLASVYFTDANTGYVVGGNFLQPLSSIILKTTNGGTTWTSIPSCTTYPLQDVFFADENIGYAVGPDDIIKTTDAGATWSSPLIGYIGGSINSVFFTDTITGYITISWVSPTGGGSAILKTTDGGIHWNALEPSPVLSIFFTNTDTGYAVAGEYIHKTINGGLSWTTITIGTNVRLDAVFFADTNIGFAAGSNLASGEGIILKTTDGGITWNYLSCGTTSALYSIYFPDSNTGYSVGKYGTIIKTINGGQSWFPMSSGTTESLSSVFFSEIDTGYIVGDSGTLLKTTNGGGYPVGINDRNQTNNTLNIYPNPSSTNITIETSAIPTHSTLSISNIDGQELITRQITEPKSTIDISSLFYGIYFVRVVGEKKVQVGKFIRK